MVKIANLYYDLLNLYGEDGNIKALSNALDFLDVEYTIDNLTISDNLDLLSYDFIYIGSGTEKNIKLVANHMLKFQDMFKSYIDHDKVILATGNSPALFGKYIKNLDESKTITLNIFNYHYIEKKERIVSEVMFKLGNFHKMIGFYNTSYEIHEEHVKNYSNIFKINKSIGYNFKNENEGISKNNFYGTNIIGPILVRNPEFLRFIISRILEKCEIILKDSTKAMSFDLETKAREEFIKNYYENKKNKKIH